MRVIGSDLSQAKGWYCGPWDSTLEVSVGYAHQGIDEPHLHRSIHEIYCVARGSAVVRVEGERVRLEQGQVLVVEPGEAHTFVSSSADYMHFVIQAPGLRGEEARADKVLLP